MAKPRFARLLFSLFILLSSISVASPTTASSDVLRWSAVDIPAEGRAGDWVLAAGSDIQHLTMAIDGTLYAYANPAGTSYRLFKSADGGYSWSYLKVENTIVALATSPVEADTIYYATSSKVYKSANAGSSFTLLPPEPGGAGSSNIEITSLDVAYTAYHAVVVGTRDSDSGQYGGLYLFEENGAFTWLNTNVGSYDVYAASFSPDYPADQQLVAVVTDEADTLVTTRIGNSGWNQVIDRATLDKDNSRTPTSVRVDTSAAIAFPDDYEAIENYNLFIAIDAGAETGDVYKITGEPASGISAAIDLDIGSVYGLNNVDVTTLAVAGNAATAEMLAGAAGSAQVYLSPDGGRNWARSAKAPTGQSRTYILIAPDFRSGGRAYAATSGAESAISHTTDNGAAWNQIGLIDTSISSFLDLSLSPAYAQDNALFLVTFGGKHSLWRSLNGGAGWERVFSSAPAHVDSFTKVKVSPNFSISGVIFVAGSSNGNPAVWKSTDNGQNFISQTARDPVSGATFEIDAWTIADDNTLFVGSYDGSKGVVYQTTNSGLFYTTRALAGTRSLYSIALSPDFAQDKTIMVGNTYGEIYWSNDGGISFERLGLRLIDLVTAGSDTNSVTVTFDPDFSHNNTVYAASHCQKGAANASAIYRFKIGTSADWDNIDSTMPSGAIINQLIASTDGTLYAINSKAGGGLERSLDPTYSLGPAFETVSRGLADSATLNNLQLYRNQLWSIDTTNKRVMTYTDTLISPVGLTSPSDKASGIITTNVNIDWETLDGATRYTWQLDYDTDFSTVPAGFEGNTRASTARLPSLEVDTTYYWRVRAIEPVFSPWSAKRSFTTILGSAVIAPKLYSPKAAESGVSLKPVFQWSAIAGAEGYELLVSTEASFADSIIVRIGDYALSGTAWQSNISLNYETTYYWKVRAYNSETYSAWSAVGAFITKLAPELASPESDLSPPQPMSLPSLRLVPPPPPPPVSSLPLAQQPSPPPVSSPPSVQQPSSAPPAAQSFLPGWIIYLAVALLMAIVLLLVILLALVAGRRRY